MNYSIIVWGFDTDNDYQHDSNISRKKITKGGLDPLFLI